MKNIKLEDSDSGFFEAQLRELSKEQLKKLQHTSGVKTIKDMTLEEIRNIEETYGAKVIINPYNKRKTNGSFRKRNRFKRGFSKQRRKRS